MKAIFFTLVFQFLILSVCASELCNSDSVLIKTSVALINNKLSKNEPSILSKNQIQGFEKINAESDTIKKVESNLDENQSIDKKQKKTRKNRGKLLAILTFLSGGASIILLFATIIMAFTRSVGTSLVLGIGLGLIPITFILGFFALRQLKKNSKEKNQSDIYNLLAMSGILLALIPLAFILFAFALLFVSFMMGDLYM